MMSKVKKNGPAFLLRISLAKSASLIEPLLCCLPLSRSSDLHEPGAKHFLWGPWEHHMVQIEPVDGSSLDMRRVVQTRETGGRAAPFCNRGVYERLPAKFGDCGGECLGRGGSPVGGPHPLGALCPLRPHPPPSAPTPHHHRP